uniref:Uncharacterized protein n=1 Tax=Moniliophthora roreri TaxID=221103 RepID=A0A0W0GDW8_MONRR
MHAGQTVLPGGMMDKVDGQDPVTDSEMQTKRFLCLSLPIMTSTSYALKSHLFQHTLLVISAITLLTHPNPQLFIEQTLKPSPNEVSRIFSHLLRAVLDSRQYLGKDMERLAERGS